MVQLEFSKTEGIRLTLSVYSDEARTVLVNATSVTITITDPTGTAKVSAATPTNSSTGNYYYDYSVPSDGPEGTWKVKWSIVSGGLTTVGYDYFKVEG